MKRHLDLIREILILLNKDELPSELKVNGFTDEQIGYHCYILKDAKFIRAADTSIGSRVSAIPLGLTWEGHEFVDNAQNEKFWVQAKNKIKGIGGTVSLSILTNTLDKVMQGALEQQ